jgi:hypothetical protein
MSAEPDEVQKPPVSYRIGRQLDQEKIDVLTKRVEVRLNIKIKSLQSTHALSNRNWLAAILFSERMQTEMGRTRTISCSTFRYSFWNIAFLG